MVQGRYLIVQMIGSGETGEVYLAVDQGSGSAVMLKRTFFDENTGLKESLELRSKPLLSLRHPVLPKVIDSFVEDGQHFLVMEHISGSDLATRLEESRKPFPLSWGMFWADQLLDALTYMHSQTPAIIHGDIKPANLKLTEENHIVLLDHGLATGQNLNAVDGERKLSPYASPEQVRGAPVTSASDIYSFAATFYHLMTNVVPSGARKRADAIRNGLPDPLISISKANPEISADIAEVLEKGLDVSPDKRFAVATEMQKALRRAYKKSREGTTARTVEFRHANEPTVEMHGQSDVMAADAVTVADDLAPETSEVPTHTHIGGTGDEPTIELGAADILPDPIVPEVGTEVLPAHAASDVASEAAPQPIVTSSVRPAARPAKRRSRAGLFIGGLITLLVLASIGIGGGWYVYNNYYKTAQVLPSPSPAPSPAISPSPASETVLASDSNANSDSNTNNLKAGETNSNDEDPGRVTVASTTPSTGKPIQNPARTTNPVRSPQPPKTRPSVKPKAGDDRTVILQ